MAGNWIGVSCGLVLPCTDEAGAGPTKCKHRDIQLSDTPADLSALTFVPQLGRVCLFTIPSQGFHMLFADRLRPVLLLQPAEA